VALLILINELGVAVFFFCYPVGWCLWLLFCLFSFLFSPKNEHYRGLSVDQVGVGS